jgi:nitrate/TMAO reductase-like tetraheme cytochrome c subunit
MLVRQQADAMIQARKKIVAGAVDIAGDSIAKLQEKGVTMSNHEVERMSANLIIAICGDNKIAQTHQV